MFNAEVAKVLPMAAAEKSKMADAGVFAAHETKPMVTKTLQYVKKFSAVTNDATLQNMRKWVRALCAWRVACAWCMACAQCMGPQPAFGAHVQGAGLQADQACKPHER